MVGKTPREEELASHGTRAAEVILGLEAMAAFLRAHPDLPLYGGPAPFHYFPCGTDEEERAEVDRIAAILGVKAAYMPGSRTHYRAVRDFGGGIEYTAIAITAAAMAEHYALGSYAGCVQPEPAVA